MRIKAITEIMDTIIDVRDAHTTQYALNCASNARGKVSLSRDLGLISEDEVRYYNDLISHVISSRVRR